METIREIIDEVGFDAVGECAVSDLKVSPLVREMCSADRCQQYDKSWACPPACGSIEEFQEQFKDYDRCYVVQTVRELEDDFDAEGMLEAADTQKQRVLHLAELLEAQPIDTLILSAGTCTICPTCTYPDEPCRFPEKRFVSMEAAGLNVTESCKAASIPYNHGPNTIAYSSCVLF